jgi:hypothetical protein
VTQLAGALLVTESIGPVVTGAAEESVQVVLLRYLGGVGLELEAELVVTDAAAVARSVCPVGKDHRFHVVSS